MNTWLDKMLVVAIATMTFAAGFCFGFGAKRIAEQKVVVMFVAPKAQNQNNGIYEQCQ